MAVWIIEPRDPLIVRDGRPFGPTPGARASTLMFPFPSTITGGIRTRAGLDMTGVFDASLIKMVKGIGVRGPLLVELDDDGVIDNWLCPAPSDALLLESKPPDANAICKRLTPLEFPQGARTNLDEGLSLVGLANPDLRKPHNKAPRYWYWDKYKDWLLNSGANEPADDRPVLLQELGHNGPQPESRTHIRIQSDTQASVEGALFQTRGLEFTRVEQRLEDTGQVRRRMALAIAVDDIADAEKIQPGLSPLGGERRLVSWLKSQAQLPDCPNELRDQLIRQRHCRLLLLTPAHFQRGSRPTWLVSQQGNVSTRLLALSIGRPQVVSGWDFENSQPKPTRRLAPAGTTFFLELDGSEESISNWIDAIWMQCVSDDEQDRRDGFGLAVLGAWDGISRKME